MTLEVRFDAGDHSRHSGGGFVDVVEVQVGQVKDLVVIKGGRQFGKGEGEFRQAEIEGLGRPGWGPQRRANNLRNTKWTGRPIITGTRIISRPRYASGGSTVCGSVPSPKTKLMLSAGSVTR